MKSGILIIGKVPPPIGGVTVHVSRLLEHLQKKSLRHTFIALKITNTFLLLKALASHRTVHLHTSNPQVRAIFSMLFKVTPAKLLITYHGNLGRFNRWGNLADDFSIRHCQLPLVLNQGSLEKALELNPQAQLVSAFIPPTQESEDEKFSRELAGFIHRFESSFCTNAFNVSFDSDRNEVYGISDLVRIFEKHPQWALVLSDPSGNYRRYLAQMNVKIGANILVVDSPHSFLTVLKVCSTFLRTTTTDGDSISVKEALFLGKNVIASDCTERPEGVRIFPTGDFSHLENIMQEGFETSGLHNNIPVNGALELIRLYGFDQ